MEILDAMTRKVNWARDSELLNLWQGSKAVVIGRGENRDYIKDESVASFKGKLFGCNRAYKVYNNLDALLWLDHSFWLANCVSIRRLDCMLFAINSSIGDNIPLRVLRKGPQRPACTGSFDAGFWTKNLSGFVALNTAIALGADPIWLHGFNANYKREHFIERVEQFSIVADWCNDNGRTVYIANEGSALLKFFKYKRLPVPKAARTGKG